MNTNEKNNAQTRLTHQFKNQLATKVKRLYINKELIQLVTEITAKLPVKDKILALHFFKKLAIQIIREPEPNHYQAFKDEYEEELSAIADEQSHFEPVRWINAEIEYFLNTTERLTSEDVNQRLDIMQDAKQKLSKAWLTKAEVMELFDISKSTLNRRIAEGMPAHKNGKAIYFYLEEINEWMRKEAA